MVVKERIVVDTLFSDINNCVKTVKEWFNTKGYKKITMRNPDRWSTAVILDIAKGGLMSKTTIQATFKSHAGGNSIMIEILASNDGTGLSGKPMMSAAPDPKDKPYEALAMDLSKFVKTTWKRGSGAGYVPQETAPSTMYQPTTPSYQSPALQQQDYNYQNTQQYGSYQQPAQQTYQEQQYGAYQEQPQTNYETPAPQETYQQPAEQVAPEPAPVVEAPPVVEEPVVQEPQPIVAPEPVIETPTPAVEPEISDDEAARLEAELAAEEPGPEPEVVKPGLDPSEVPTDIKLQFGVPEFPSVDEEPPAYTAPPPAAVPIPEAPAPRPVEVPAPEPLTPQPVLEPQPEIAPIQEATPTPEAQPVQPATPTESFCPGCGKKTKPKWRTCPYCEHDLMGTKAAETPAPVVVAPVEAVVEPVVSQAAPVDTTQTLGNVTATCPTCPTCGQAPTWIDDYKRYYCYTCSQYL